MALKRFIIGLVAVVGLLLSVRSASAATEANIVYMGYVGQQITVICDSGYLSTPVYQAYSYDQGDYYVRCSSPKDFRAYQASSGAIMLGNTDTLKVVSMHGRYNWLNWSHPYTGMETFTQN